MGAVHQYHVGRSPAFPGMRSFVLLLTSLLMMKGVLGQARDVRYNFPSLTAQEDSNISIPCSFSSPINPEIRKMVWYKLPNVIVYETNTDRIHSSYKGRTHFLGNNHSDCTLQITELQLNDSGTYRFVAYFKESSYTGQPAKITVAENLCRVSVTSSDTFEEGREGMVICSVRNNSGITPDWYYSNGTYIPDQIHSSSKSDSILKFTSSREDNGRVLQCRRRDCPVEELKLDVWYKPGEPQITMYPANGSRVQEGAAVTLTCTSQSNPLAINYLWYRKGELIEDAEKQTLHILKASAANVGKYTCKAQNTIGYSKLSLPLRLNVQCSSCRAPFPVLPVTLGAVGFLLVALGIGIFFYMRSKKRHKAAGSENINTTIITTSLETAAKTEAQDDKTSLKKSPKSLWKKALPKK